MDNDYENLWEAMKETKYTNTFEELEEKITSAKDADSALSMLLELVVKAAHAEAGTLWYYDKNGSGYIYARAVYGGANLSNTKLEIGDGIAGHVILNNTPYIISNCKNTFLWNRKVDDSTGFKTKSMICVPLTVKGSDKPFAAIQIINRINGTLFDEKDREFTNEIANRIVDLFINKGDKKTLDIISYNNYNLGLDLALNQTSEKEVTKYLKIKLREAQIKGANATEIINKFLEIYRIVRK